MKGIVTILRFVPSIDRAPHYEDYSFDYIPGIKVLDVLHQVREKYDRDLSYRWGCRDGSCGLCGVMVDGQPALVCKQEASRNMTLTPLAHLLPEKDLIVRRDSAEREFSFLPHFHPGSTTLPEARILDGRLELRYLAGRCVNCRCCQAVCPVKRRHPHNFWGPALFARIAKILFDPRNGGSHEAALEGSGIVKCVECGRCSAVCPHKADPCRLIAAMK
ncbi:MAG: 4Fe-4S dicluster domain-containing protein [Synergistaceae bacterium]|jgi:succinate dehydrogenase/fumarate reductase iron-sulfur protein|nr:4Fe-4S dicluster domain-containing protein [Synergistaceae bacterium]